uniref:Nuclear receptor n=1 Tax=Strongyloides venezuelensis TaxID=75913 RepID=A0A0K0EXM0_STRVS
MANPNSTHEENLPTNMGRKNFKLQTALCSICNGESTGIHFGAESCGSCSAFFRRSVVMGKIYSYHSIYCKSEYKWKKCRACRLQRCYEMGMIKSAVQNKRDAIGKQSKQGIIARENFRKNNLLKNTSGNGELNIHNQTPTTSNILIDHQPYQSLKVQDDNIIEELFRRYQILKDDRKLFYTEKNSFKLFDDNINLEPSELSDFGDCLHLLWRIEPRLIIKFISTNKFIKCLHPEEKFKIYKNFLPFFQALEEPYLTWISDGINLNWWMMANKTYIDMSNIDEYFTTKNVFNYINLDKETIIKLFISSYKNAIDLIAKVMEENNINEYEFVFLIALLLFEPTIPDIKEETIKYLQKLRDHVFVEMYNYEKHRNNCKNVDVKIGSIIMILSGVKIHTKKVIENSCLLRTFSILPKNKLYDIDTFYAY